ncbi:hypothetical protein PAMP_013546 [Pampus punctatissimus]
MSRAEDISRRWRRGRVSLVQITTLRLEGLQLDDQGLYECRILLLDKPTDELRNGTWTLLSVTGWSLISAGSEHAISRTVHLPRLQLGGKRDLRDESPPVIIIPPKSTSLNMSQNAFLQCQAVADPPNMTYVWQKGGENVHHIE